MPHASRLASRLTLWAFAAALLLKSAVPMLASAAAGLQGKALADVCDVYGVDMSALAARSADAAWLPTSETTPTQAMTMPAMAGDAHAMHHAHGHLHSMSGAAAGPPSRSSSSSLHADVPADPGPAPSHHPGGSHAGDHCALTGMVALATETAAPLVVPADALASTSTLRRDGAVVFDAAARWAALLRHGPPALS